MRGRNITRTRYRSYTGGVQLPPSAQSAYFYNQGITADGQHIIDEKNKGTPRPVQPGRGYLLDGIDDKIDSDVALTGWTEATIIRWAEYKSFNSFDLDGNWSTSAANNSIRLGRNSSRQIRVGFGGSSDYTTSETIAENQMHCLALSTKANGNYKIYLDGAKVRDAAATGFTTNLGSVANFMIGEDGSGAHPSNYLVAGYMIFSRQLTDDEMDFLFSRGEFGTDPTMTDCEFYYKCDDKHPAIAYDSSGKGNHGTKSGITLSTFHYEGSDLPLSFQNDYGYSRYFNFYNTNFLATGIDASSANKLRVEMDIAWLQAGSNGYCELLGDDDAAGYSFRIYPTSNALELAAGGYTDGSQAIRFVSNGVAVLSPNTYDSISFEYDNTSKDATVASSAGEYSDNLGAATLSTLDNIRLGGRTAGGGNFVLKSAKIYIDDVLVGDYDESTGLIDNSGNSNHLIPTDPDSVYEFAPRDESVLTSDALGGSLVYRGTAPKNIKLINSACGDFDGANDYGNTLVPSNFTTDLILFCEFEPDVVATDDLGAHRLFQISEGTATRLSLAVNDSKVVMAHNTSTFALSPGVSVSIGDKVKACVRRSGTTLELYVNGVLVDAVTGSLLAINAENINVGSSNGGVARLFDGGIWNVQFYDSALSQTDCEQLTTDGIPIGSPYRWWPMSDRGQSSIASNVMSASGDITLNGVASTFFDRDQDKFHYNIRYGFRKSGSIFIPALSNNLSAADGNSITNPSGRWHNDAETEIDLRGEEPNAPWVVQNYLCYAEFDGVSSSLVVPTSHDFSSEDFSISFNVRFYSLTSSPVLLGQTDGSGTGRSLVYTDGGDRWSTHIGGSQTSFTGIPLAAIDTDYEVLFEKVGSTATLTVDSVSQSVTPPAMESSDGDLVLGAHKALATDILDGRLSDVVFSNATVNFSLDLARDALDRSGNGYHALNNNVTFPVVPLPTAYPFGDTLPDMMTKETSTNKESQFTITKEC